MLNICFPKFRSNPAIVPNKISSITAISFCSVVVLRSRDAHNLLSAFFFHQYHHCPAIQSTMNVDRGIHPLDPISCSAAEPNIKDLEDVSEWLRQNLFETSWNHQNDESNNIPLLSNEQSWSCFDATMDSLEPTPISPTGVSSVMNAPQNVSSLQLPSSGFLDDLRVSSSSFPVLDMPSSYQTSGIVDISHTGAHRPVVVDEVKSFTPMSFTSKPARTASGRDTVEDSCYIRPSKMARMVSASSGMDIALHDAGMTSIMDKKAQSKKIPSANEKTPAKESKGDRFRAYQNDQWMERFHELKVFKVEHGHCLVPHNHLFEGSPALAQWVKRYVKHSGMAVQKTMRTYRLFLHSSHSFLL